MYTTCANLDDDYIYYYQATEIIIIIISEICGGMASFAEGLSKPNAFMTDDDDGYSSWSFNPYPTNIFNIQGPPTGVLGNPKNKLL